jgi:hypothetical protein
MKAMTDEPDDPATPAKQIDKFHDLARKLGCDEDDVTFEDAVRKIATAPRTEQEDKD